MDGMLNFVALAALATAFCWGLSPLISANVSARMGAISFVRWRMWVSFIVLVVIITLGNGWQGYGSDDLRWLVLSGFIGLFIGDTLLFASMNVIGPRRASILYATNAAMAAGLAALLFGEVLTLVMVGAFACVTVGVMLAIFFGKSRDNQHIWEMNRGMLSVGIGLGLLSALAQAVGSLAAKPALLAGGDRMVAAAIRLGCAALCHSLFQHVRPAMTKCHVKLNLRDLGWVCLSSLNAMALGMTLFMYALANGDVGWVSVLSSTAPIMTLPMLWLIFRHSPPAGAWFGALLTVVGTAVILMKI